MIINATVPLRYKFNSDLSSFLRGFIKSCFICEPGTLRMSQNEGQGLVGDKESPNPIDDGANRHILKPILLAKTN